MKHWHALQHAAHAGDLTRRGFLAGAGVVAGALLVDGLTSVADAKPAGPQRPRTGPGRGRTYTDDPVTLEWIKARWTELGVWGDTKGSLREINAAKRADALRIPLAGTSKVYDLGEPMRPGIPAFAADPPRRADYYVVSVDTGFANRFVFQDERFEAFTFQISTQIDELNHPSWDGWLYGGFELKNLLPRPDITDNLARAAKAAADSAAANYGPDSILGGTESLGLHNMGPIVTRGLLLDVLGYMQAVGRSSALSDDGRTLKPGYRITIADLEDTLEWEGLRRGIQPGDAVVIRTGWTSYLQEGPPYATYLGPVPGPWVAEAHWLADHRPALVASDTYAMEVFPGPGPALGRLAEAHQVLMVANGIRIGEGFNSAELAADRVYEFLFIDTPYNLHGATCAGNAPAAIGVPRRGRR